MSIGEKIAALRKGKGWTQAELGEKLGVSNQAVSKWECGASSPDLSLIVPLAKLLHVTTDELLGMADDETDERKLEYDAFRGCKFLSTITFQGTTAQWKNIKTLSFLGLVGVPATVVHCTDGDVEI